MTDEAIASLTEEVGAEVNLKWDDFAAISSELTESTLDILHKANRGSHGGLLFEEQDVISDDRMWQVALYAMRDIGRVRRDQDDKTSVAKYVGYIGFWFAKLKPINTVWRTKRASEAADNEVYDINERVALVLMDYVLLRLVAADAPENAPTIWRQCAIADCKLMKGVNGACYFKKAPRFLSQLSGRFKEYLVYTLRYRAGGPYLLINYLEEAIFYNCEQANPPLFAA